MMPLPTASVRKNFPIAALVGVLLTALSAGAVEAADVPPAKVMATVTASCPVNAESRQAQNIRVVSTNAKDGSATLSLTCGGRTFHSRRNAPESGDAAASSTRSDAGRR